MLARWPATSSSRPVPDTELVPITGGCHADLSARHHAEHHHLLQVRQGAVGVAAVAFRHHMDVGDFEDAGLDRLHFVAEARRGHDHGRVRGAHDLDFVLADADGFDDHGLVARDIEDIDRVERGARHAAGRAARRHRADIDAGIVGHVGHADAVAEDGAAGIGARRIDRDHADLLPGGADFLGEFPDQRGLAAARHAGDADDMRLAGELVDLRRAPARTSGSPASAREISRATAAGSPFLTRSISATEETLRLTSSPLRSARACRGTRRDRRSRGAP